MTDSQFLTTFFAIIFGGFTMVATMAGLYAWDRCCFKRKQERRRK
jgi:hypothetical protein